MKIQLSDHFTYRRLLRFVFPSIVMMVFTSIYGVVDGLFVSNFVGKDAFAAINLIMPFLMIFGGVGFMFGTGGSALVAMTLGEKKKERANEYFTMIVAGTAIVGAIISLIACFIMRPVAIWLGAEGEIITDCVIYGRIMMIFNIAFMLQNAFQGFFITAEKPHLGLVTTVAAGAETPDNEPSERNKSENHAVPASACAAGRCVKMGCCRCCNCYRLMPGCRRYYPVDIFYTS